MSSDRELLEMAAKAAGYEWDTGVAEYRAAQNPPLIALWIPTVSTAWNPLEDDGQALRLAVKLAIAIDPLVPEPHGDDPRSATRRAIVRAAAEIGRALADELSKVCPALPLARSV